jgi:hypothetical protein
LAGKLNLRFHLSSHSHRQGNRRRSGLRRIAWCWSLKRWWWRRAGKRGT